MKTRKKRSPSRVFRRRGCIISASKTVSRVLYLTVIYLDALLPVRSSHPGSGRASLYAPIPVLLRIEFTASRCSHVMGELLPRLSTLARERNSHGRYISVALFLKSPSAGVTRYPCPVEPGLSSWTAFRPAHATVCLPRSPHCSGFRRPCQWKSIGEDKPALHGVVPGEAPAGADLNAADRQLLQDLLL